MWLVTLMPIELEQLASPLFILKYSHWCCQRSLLCTALCTVHATTVSQRPVCIFYSLYVNMASSFGCILLFLAGPRVTVQFLLFLYLDLKTVNQITGEIFIPYWVAHVTVLKLIQCLYTNTNKLYIVIMMAC